MDGWETARRIRAHGIHDLPIIMVSADAFENQSDKIAAAGCQGFVDKPVIESELLAVLQRHLELEWVAELAVPNWTPPEIPHTATAALPQPHAQALLRLAKLGHAQGLQRALDALVGEQPEFEPQVAALRSLVTRFAWDDLIALLSDELRVADGEMAS
jgi:DNA-binding NarL/FixJ family response regulator